MPALLGSYQYIPLEGALVLIIGFNGNTQQLEPVGVGRITNRQVISEGQLHITHLDYLGYALKGVEAQNSMQQYLNGDLSFQAMVASLNSEGR